MFDGMVGLLCLKHMQVTHGDFDWSFLRFSLAGLIFSDVYEGMQSWILVVLHGELMLLSICPSLESFGSYEPSNLPSCYKLVSYSPSIFLSFFPLYFSFPLFPPP